MAAILSNDSVSETGECKLKNDIGSNFAAKNTTKSVDVNENSQDHLEFLNTSADHDVLSFFDKPTCQNIANVESKNTVHTIGCNRMCVGAEKSDELKCEFKSADSTMEKIDVPFCNWKRNRMKRKIDLPTKFISERNIYPVNMKDLNLDDISSNKFSRTLISSFMSVNDDQLSAENVKGHRRKKSKKCACKTLSDMDSSDTADKVTELLMVSTDDINASASVKQVESADVINTSDIVNEIGENVERIVSDIADIVPIHKLVGEKIEGDDLIKACDTVQQLNAHASDKIVYNLDVNAFDGVCKSNVISDHNEMTSVLAEPVHSAVTSHSKQNTAQTLSKKNSKFKRNPFIYGNYNRYYGYRNPQLEDDHRLQLFKSEFFKGKDVLDIGCNIGHVTLMIARDFVPRRIVGMDIDRNLIEMAKKNIKYYVKKESTFSSDNNLWVSSKGPCVAACLSKNVMFLQGNYVLENDELLKLQQEEYDVILALSITKWIHLNFGDDGLKRAFQRMYRQLKNEGKLVLEPQEWPSYRKKKKVPTATLR